MPARPDGGGRIAEGFCPLARGATGQAMIRAIIFDKDGTLTDFRATWGAGTQAVLASLSEGDAGLAARLGWALGYDPVARSFEAESPAVTGPSSAIVDLLAPHLPHIDRAVLDWRFAAASAEVAQVPAVDLPLLFTTLSGSGYILGVVTNDTEGSAREHLEGFGVAGHVSFVAGADSGHGAKPDPGPLLAFSAATGVPPRAVVMVGDTGHDLNAGRAAGMATVGVLTGMTPAARLAPLADAVLPDIGHLPAWLSGH